MIEDLSDIDETAELLGIHSETLRRFARQSKIPALKVGRAWRFSRERMNEWVETKHVRSGEVNVLVVDDEEPVREVIRITLEEENYHVTTVGDAPSAIEMLQASLPDIVLLDLELLNGSGVDVFEEICSKDKHIPVIIITGYPDSELLQKALRYGPFLVIVKSVMPNQLLDAVRGMLQGKGDRAIG